jgi:hypothetical protein
LYFESALLYEESGHDSLVVCTSELPQEIIEGSGEFYELPRIDNLRGILGSMGDHPHELGEVELL